MCAARTVDGKGGIERVGIDMEACMLRGAAQIERVHVAQFSYGLPTEGWEM